MNLFQIEEPDGSPGPVDGPGAAVGIHLARDAAVAFALGGNAEILAREALTTPAETLRALRGRAEKMLTRPVTHAVIAGDDIERTALLAAAQEAGLTVIRAISTKEAARVAGGAPPDEAVALGAAMLAEDDAPGGGAL